MHTNIRLHKNDVGLLQALSTNATNEGEFLAAITDVLRVELRHELLRSRLASTEAKAVDATVDLFGILLGRTLPHIVEITCRLRGYKADVIEHRVIVAGAVLPDDLVDLFPNELAVTETA